MTIAPAGTPLAKAHGLTADDARFLTDLAAGKYDGDIQQLDKWFTTGSAALPQLLVAKRIIDVLVALNKATAPLRPLVSDGAGGWVPSDNSRVDPATGAFL